jgi:exopolysaccharide biosynthesis protein
MNTSRKRTIFGSVVAFFLILGTVSYLLADRYLIEHVEISQAVATSTVATTVLTTESSPVEDLTTTENAVTETEDTSSTITADDWNYTSDSVSIAIREVTTGSGDDTITYYVADVVVSDATQLRSAFAKNEFGRNIIEYTSAIAEENNAIFAINGDYYGFRSDGIIIRNGVIYRDVPARTGLAFYLDGTIKIYDETQTSAEELLAEGVWNTLSFGPALVEDGAVVSNLGTVAVDTNLGNHSIQGSNPRTGVGIIDENHFVFVVVDGRSDGYSRGMTLTEFATLFKELGCEEAYNIDGGGSSTMYFMGRVVNNPLGKNKERGTSDILYIG